MRSVPSLLGLAILLALPLAPPTMAEEGMPSEGPRSAGIGAADVTVQIDPRGSSIVGGGRLPGGQADINIDDPLPKVAQQSAAFDAVDACVRQEMQNRNTPGASLAIAVDGQQVYTQTYGTKRGGFNEPIFPSSYFRINSTTKMMGAAAVLKLVEQGKLDLRAPVTDYLPDYQLREPWQSSEQTLHHLLSGTSGLFAPYVAYDRLTPDTRPEGDLDLQEWLRTMKGAHLFAPPGSFFNYSSVGFSVAAAALERVDGRLFGDIVEQELWRPNGMLRTTMDADVVLADGDYAHGHMWGRHFEPDEYDEEWSQAGGGAYATPSELLKWAGMLSEGGRGILSPESVSAMTSPQAAVSNVPITTYASYGYGVFVEDFRPQSNPGERVRVLYHPGNGRGYSTELFWVPETGFAVAILASTPAGLQNSAICALREVEGLTRLPVDRSPPSDNELQRYTGSWSIVDAFGKTWTARVWKAFDGLKIRYDEWSALPSIAAVVPEASMSHRHGSVFRYEGYGRTDARFVEDESRPMHPQWLEQGGSVGQRAGDFPEEIEVESGSCTPFTFTPDLDRPGSALRAYGPDPVHALRGLTATQDNPERPDLSSYKLDLEAAGEVTFFMAYHWAEQDDDLDLYLLHDADEDGAFAWPEELVDQAISDGAAGLLVKTPLPAGRYQFWVHGKQVRGSDSRYDLDVVMVAGDGLRLEMVPEQIEARAEQTVGLCAGPMEGDEPQLGMVGFDLGDGLRKARVTVRVLPKPEGDPFIYLPALNP